MVQKQRRRGREVVRPVADADGGADGRQDRDEADVIVRREVLRRTMLTPLPFSIR